jgi:Tfp pilus assembly protein PilF
MRLLRWKFVLPMIGAALAITAGRWVAGWSTPEPFADDPLRAGFSELFSNHYAKAELLFEQARALDPGNGEAYHGLALLALTRHGDVARAEALFRQAVALPGTSAFANFGRFLIAEHRYGEAVPVLESALARDPHFVPARARLAIALFALDRNDEACRLARSVGDDVPDAEAPLVARIRDAPDCATR